MGTERLSFPNENGQSLSARLELPENAAPRAYALFAHCFTCSKNVKAAFHISRALAAEGIATLRFDFTGLGESEGDFADTNFSSNVDDLVAAAEFVSHEYDAPRVLVGHSLGGSAVLQAAGRIPSVAAVATIAAPFEPSHLSRRLEHARPELEERGEVEVTIGGRGFTVRKQLLDDLDATRMHDTIARLGRALAVFHSPDDAVVGMENAVRIFDAAQHPKMFVSLDGSDHLLSLERDSRYVGALIAAWAARYIAAPGGDTRTTPKEPS